VAPATPAILSWRPCYNLARQMAEEGHRRDKKWLDDALDTCDRTYG
jgi:hypothetical protein